MANEFRVKNGIITGGSIVPETNNSYDLGSSSLAFNDLFLDNKIYLRDTALQIFSSTDGQIDIDADDTIDMTATTQINQETKRFTVSSTGSSGATGTEFETATFDVLNEAGEAGTVVTFKSTQNSSSGAAELKFVLDKGAAGADGDDLGKITFVGDDDNQTQTDFGQILVEVSDASNSDEAGKMSLLVAESNGTTTALTAGLVLEGEHATDGEVDVTIAAGTGSTTTVAGNLTVNGNFLPGSDDSHDIGSASAAFQDLFLEGDITLTDAGSLKTSAGNFTIDSAADVIIDVDGADIILKDNGTAFGRFKRSSSDFIIKCEDDDNDIIFKGEDGGSTITALTLDMSAAGEMILDSGSMKATDVSGTDTGGNSLTIKGGNATGDALPGSILFQLHEKSGTSGSSSTSLGTGEATAMSISNGGTVTVGIGNNSPTASTASTTVLDIRGPVGQPGVLTLSTKEADLEDGNTVGVIEFHAPLQSAGGDANLLLASITAEADATHSSTVNTTDLVFKTATSTAAAEAMRIKGNKAITMESTLTFTGFILDGNTISGIDDSGEFTNDDNHIMTSAAIEDKITGYGYTTNTGDITGVTAGTNLSGGGSSGSVTLNVDDAFLVNDADDTTSGTITAAGFTTTGTWTFDDASSGTVGITTVHTGSGFADNDTSLMTAGAIKEKIEDYGYTTNTGDMTGVSISVNTGLDISQSNTTSGSYSATLSLDLSEFTDMTASINASQDELILLDNGAERRKLISEIPLSAFDNDSGFTTNTGDITGVDLTVTSPITIASETNTTSGSYSATLGLDDPANLSELNESTDATTDKILLWDESGSSWKYMTLDNLQDSIDTTGGGGGMSDLVDDTSPQLGGDLDTNGHDIIIDDDKGIYADAISNGRELMLFGHTTNATAYFKIWNGISDASTGTLFGTDVISDDTVGGGRMVGPGIEATGSATDVGFTMRAKGLGQFVLMNDDTTASAAPVLNLLRYHTGEADNDVLGLIKFMGPDSSMDSPGLEDHRDYAKIECNLVDTNTSSADGNLMFSALVANSHTDMMRVGVHEDDDNAVGVALFRGQMIDHGSNHTLSYADEAGCYVRATAAITLTLPASPSKGEQYVIISDHAGTTTISADGSDTMNGSTSNQTITTRYEAKTFIAVSSSAWIVIG